MKVILKLAVACLFLAGLAHADQYIYPDPPSSCSQSANTATIYGYWGVYMVAIISTACAGIIIPAARCVGSASGKLAGAHLRSKRGWRWTEASVRNTPGCKVRLDQVCRRTY
jgi:hypothetical protein